MGMEKLLFIHQKQGQLLVYDSSLTLDTTLSDVGIYNTFGNVSKSVSNQDRHIYLVTGCVFRCSGVFYQFTIR